jgi:hypothetical protein
MSAAAPVLKLKKILAMRRSMADSQVNHLHQEGIGEENKLVVLVNAHRALREEYLKVGQGWQFIRPMRILTWTGMTVRTSRNAYHPSTEGVSGVGPVYRDGSRAHC